MFILTLSHMGMVVFLLGDKLLIPRWGRGVWARKLSPPLFSPGFKLISPQSHPYFSYLTACDGVVYRHKKFKGGGLVHHQPSAKDHQAEGLGPE